MTTMQPLPALCLWLLARFGSTFAGGNNQADITVVVKEQENAILNCSLSTNENIEQKLFDWKKDGKMEVFLYNAGVHYNNGRSGQDEHFKGRVSHFPEQLKVGNASIIINNTKIEDTGIYTCDFPRLQPNQRSHISLVVGSATIPATLYGQTGASPKPSFSIVQQTQHWALLQCEVQGASPKPSLLWKDNSGNVLKASEPQVTERGGRYDVTLQVNVTTTDFYHCVATQDEIKHQIPIRSHVYIAGGQGASTSSTSIVALCLALTVALR